MNSVSVSQSQEAIGKLVIVSDLLMMWVFAAKNAGLRFVMTHISHPATVTTLESMVWNGPDLILICCWVRFDSGAALRSWFLNGQKYVNNFIIESSDWNRTFETINSLQWKSVFPEKLCVENMAYLQWVVWWFFFWCSFTEGKFVSCFLCVFLGGLGGGRYAAAGSFKVGK